MGIRVVTIQGQPIRAWQAALRNVLRNKKPGRKRPGERETSHGDDGRQLAFTTWAWFM